MNAALATFGVPFLPRHIEGLMSARDVCEACDLARATLYIFLGSGLRVCTHRIPEEVCS